MKENAELLCRAATSGVSFERLLTLGHQTLYLDARTLSELARRHGVASYPPDLHQDKFADRFFEVFLRAQTIVSLDASAYERAMLIQDLNLPLGGEHEESFDAVFDGGSLEHVFNFPVAIASCMRALAVGGSFFSSTVGNNCMGHGFYQFSPELFYRIFCDRFGFRADEVLAIESRHLGGEHGSVGPAYRVIDPEVLRSRVMLVNARPLSLLVRATKLQHLDDPFGRGFPQQSDYAAIWQQAGVPASSSDRPEPPGGGAARRVAKGVFARLPGGAQRWFRLRREARQHSLLNSKHFVPDKDL
ncbi:MAG: hypothetical protein ABIX12_02505 [Rubrivivax sp.]